MKHLFNIHICLKMLNKRTWSKNIVNKSEWIRSDVESVQSKCFLLSVNWKFKRCVFHVNWGWFRVIPFTSSSSFHSRLFLWEYSLILCSAFCQFACFVSLETAGRICWSSLVSCNKNAPDALEYRFVWIIPAISAN